MLTNNWYKTLAVATTYADNTGGFTAYDGTDTKKINAAKATRSVVFGNSSQDWPYLGTVLTALPQNYSCGVIFGNGDAPPTLEDYKLSGDIISGFIYSAKISKASTDNGISITATYTITNTSTSEITIKEIGVVSTLASSGYSGLQYLGLLDRTVLDEPVTIPAGGIGQVVYTITFNYPAVTTETN